jgi:ketosteroid isomerase-like protein
MKTLVSACAVLMLMTGAAAAGKMMKEQELIDLESAWSKAMVQKDTATVASIVADDWMGQNDSGKMADKARLIDEIKSGKTSATSMMNHDVRVRMMRGMAIVQGMDDEKSTAKGKDTSGTYTWMDVFEKRDGKWQAVASQITKVK